MYVAVPNQFSYSLVAMGSLGESEAIKKKFYNKVKQMMRFSVIFQKKILICLIKAV
jgi:hypothetical protein